MWQSVTSYGKIQYVYVTGPAKTNHVSTNYKSFIFANIFHSEHSVPFLQAAEKYTLNSVAVTKILLW